MKQVDKVLKEVKAHKEPKEVKAHKEVQALRVL
jgi:hypothetical protein